MSRRIKAFSEPIIPMKEISTNEEKAKEICDCDSCKACSKFAEEGAAYAFVSTCDRFDELMQAMEWKDEQHAQVRRSIRNLWKKWAKTQERQLIDRAADFISKRFYIGINNQVTSNGNYDTLTELIRDFTNSMKGE